MKLIQSALATAAFVSFALISQSAVAGPAPALCASWEPGTKVQDCTFKGGSKTGKIGAAPSDQPAKWTTKDGMTSPFACEPATFGGNPFGNTYSGKLDCYVE